MGRDHEVTLTPEVAKDVLERLGPIADEMVLIGGQAVSVWAQRYVDGSPALRADAPYTTKDIDFVGTFEQAEAVAKALGGTCERFTFGQRTPCTAIVHLPSGVQLDFLRAPLGFTDPLAIMRDSVRYEHGRVMHPYDVLQSRVANVGQLEKYQGERGLKQLRAAIECVREFSLDRLNNSPEDEAKKVRATLKLSEQVFRLAGSEDGLAVWTGQGIDVARAALTDDPRLPEPYRNMRVPQLRDHLEAQRLHHQHQQERREAKRQKHLQEAAPAPSAKDRDFER